MSVLLVILGVVVAAIVLVLLYAATRPDSFVITRATTIKAPPERIFPLINDMQKFNTWNPFAKVDPQMKLSYSGAESGKGAAYAWEGPKVGQGRMEIVDTKPPSQVVLKLDFSKPFEAHNTVEFTLQPKAEGTEVVWSMRGAMPFLHKLMSVFFSMDKMVGKDFEAGLRDMKAAAEA